MTLALEEYDSGDPALPLFRVDTGPLVATFLPAAGGRLLSLRRDGHEVLWVNPRVFRSDLTCVLPRDRWPRVDGSFASWTNIGGGKTWPAPQGWAGAGEWAGPPDAVLDSGVYAIDADRDDSTGALTVVLTSPDDARTGLRIVRRFTFREGSGVIAQSIEFSNVSPSPIRWSMWEVVQVDTATAPPDVPGEVVVEGASVSHAIDLGRYAGDVTLTDAEGNVVLPIQPGVAKYGFPDATGRISYRNTAGRGIELAFDVTGDAEYPDRGSCAEVWTQSPIPHPLPELSGLHPDAWLVELEVLSPVVTIGPGDHAEFSMEWRTFPFTPRLTESSN